MQLALENLHNVENQIAVLGASVNYQEIIVSRAQTALKPIVNIHLPAARDFLLYLTDFGVKLCLLVIIFIIRSNLTYRIFHDAFYK